MLKNYFNIALRNLTKHKFYSIINILGLSLGLACFLFISLFIKDELGYDSHFKYADNIYRMDFKGSVNNVEFNTALMSAPAAKHMKENYPEVVDAFRFRSSGTWFINEKDKKNKFKEEHVAFADSNFVEFWGIKLLNGNSKSCLANPRTLILSEKTAIKIFGNEDPVGKILVLDDKRDYTVTGVFEDLPRNSHFHYNVILSMRDKPDSNSTIWMSFNYHTYLKLVPNYDYLELESKFLTLMENKIGPEIERFMNVTLEEYAESGNNAIFSLIPLSDIHLLSNKLGEIEPNGDIKYVYIFTAIGVFILLLACINFMNLATARYSGRAKEVGLRKVMGAHRSQVIRQFLIEAILISAISTVAAFIISFAALPHFNLISGKEFNEMELFSIDFVFIMLIITIVVGLLAGSYPALYLSKFKPIETLKGKLNLGMKSSGLRSTLVVFQFVVSITMLICTTIVFEQLSFIQNKKLGFDKERIIMIHDAWILGDKSKTYKNECLRNSNIISGTLATFLPVGTTSNNNLYWAGKSASGESTHIIHNFIVDHDYVKTLNMEILEGRDFSREFAGDTLSVLVNESLVSALGFEEPIGSYMSSYWGDVDTANVTSYKIIGVLKNFHFSSLRENIEPVLFHLGNSSGYASFKVGSGNIEESLSFLEKTWKDIAPGQPFEYSFLDEKFDKIYKQEQQVGQIFGVFAFLAIFIAGLGLFGLASFTTQQRFKEIGIRKVLGASISQIINMLSWNFLKLIIIAFVIAAPLAYFGMRSWLDDFAYRTEINIWIFVLAATVSILVGWLTMGFQSYNAATANPAESLKDE